MVVEYTADIFFDLLNLSRRGIGGGETVVSVDPILLPHLVRSSVSRKHPTSSQVSAPSKLPIMTTATTTTTTFILFLYETVYSI